MPAWAPVEDDELERVLEDDEVEDPRRVTVPEFDTTPDRLVTFAALRAAFVACAAAERA